MTLAALFLAALAASPSPSPSPSPTALPVISAVRVATGSIQSLHALPVAASALDRAAIAASSAGTSDALLRTLPGFDRTRSNSMFTNYGQLRISFAGAGTDRGLMLADGIPAQDGFGGQVDWAAYPVSTVERAELLLGAGSALYGAGAVGGVLDMQTYGPPTAPIEPSGQIFFSGGSHGYSQQWSNARASISPKLGAAVSVQQMWLEYDALPPAYSSPIDRTSQGNASMASVDLRYAPGSQDTLQAGLLGSWDSQFEGRTNYTFSRRYSQSDLRYTHSTPQSTVQALLYSRNAYVVNVADLFPTKPGSLRYVQNVPTNESGESAQWISGGGFSTFELRADARHVRGMSDQFGASGSLQSSGSGSQNLGGLAAEETWRTARFEAVAGARFDTVNSYDLQLTAATAASRSDAAVSPRIALRYDLSPHLALRVSSGGGFRPPYLNELVRGYFIGNVAFGPNPSLVVERSYTNSAGADFVSSRSRLAIDGFSTFVNDAIMFRTIDPTHQIRSNVAHTETDGYTVSYTQSLGTCSRLSAWFTDQYARVTAGPPAIVNNRLQYVPEQSASVDYAGQAGRTGIGLSVSYLGQTYADDLNTQPLGTAVVVGARVRVPVSGGASFVLSASNLTDARYLSSIDRYGPPSVISLGFSLPIGSSEQSTTNACLP